jgi:hypothetical protein
MTASIPPYRCGGTGTHGGAIRPIRITLSLGMDSTCILGYELSQVNTRSTGFFGCAIPLTLTHASKIDAGRLSTRLLVCDHIEVRER